MLTVQHKAVTASYMTDLEKSCAQSGERYMKDPEKSRADGTARSHEIYMKDPEKSRADITAGTREIYEENLEKSR